MRALSVKDLCALRDSCVLDALALVCVRVHLRLLRPSSQINFTDFADEAVFKEAERIFEEQMALYGAGVPACVERLIAMSRER